MTIKYGHFKYHINYSDFTEEDIREFEKNEENYYIYTHFEIKPYKRSQSEKLEGLQSPPKNRKEIHYYVDDFCACIGSIDMDCDFEYNKKYEIRDLLLFDLLHKS